MPRYAYTVLDADGREVSGQLESADAVEAVDDLVRRGYARESIHIEPQAAGVTGRLSENETAQLGSHLAQIAAAELPLAPALAAVADELGPGRLARALKELSAEIDRGSSLDEALARLGVRVPEQLRHLVAAGQRSGKLADVLEQFAQGHRVSAQLRQQIWSALAYPGVLLTIMIGLFLFYELTVVRSMASIYDDFAIAVPPTTKALVVISRYPVPLVLAAVLLPVVAVTAWRSSREVALISRLWCSLPLVGRLWWYRRLAESSRLIALLLESAVPLPDALRLAAESAGDADLANAWTRVADSVERGRPLSQAARRAPQLPPSLMPVLNWGEERSTLPEAFRSAADSFGSRVQVQATLVKGTLPLLFFLVIFAGGALMLSATFGPMIGLIQNLSGGG